MGIFNATSSYGRGFKATEISDVYLIKIYTGGFAGKKTARNKVEKEIEKYLTESNYKSYEIIKSRRIWFPCPCFEYTVQFK
jgi:hypothetical protein